MDKEIEKVYIFWKTQFIKVTNFIPELTKDQVSDFKSRPETIEIAKFSDNEIKLAMYSAYLNKTAKLNNILQILNQNNPEDKDTKKINYKQGKKKAYSKKKILDSSELRKKQNKVQKIAATPKRSRKAELKWKKEKEMREKQLKEIALNEERKKIKDAEQSFIKNQKLVKAYQKKAEKERELNYKLYGKRLTNDEIKNLFDNKPKGWKEALDSRFEVSKQDKSYS